MQQDGEQIMNAANDAMLIEYGGQWQDAIAAERATTDGETAHSVTLQIERMIAETPANCLLGVAIKLLVFANSCDHQDRATVQAMSAYRDCLRLCKRSLAEERKRRAETAEPD